MTEHLPRHQLEELLADAVRAPELRAHLAACEHCSERLRNIEGARAAFMREHSASDFARTVMASRQSGFARNVMATSRPPRLVYGWATAFGALASDFARKVMASRRPTPRRGFGWAAAFGAIASDFARRVMASPSLAPRRGYAWTAAFGVLALAAAASSMLRDPEIRYRGANVSLQAYVQAATGAHVVHDGEVLSGGAQLAFAYTLSEPQHLLLFGIDDAGAITRYFPDGSIAQSSALPAGAKHQLPVGIELDARRGRERLIALFSTEPLDQDAARGALESAWRKMRAHDRNISEPFELALPAKQISLWFDKR